MANQEQDNMADLVRVYEEVSELTQDAIHSDQLGTAQGPAVYDVSSNQRLSSVSRIFRIEQVGRLHEFYSDPQFNPWARMQEVVRRIHPLLKESLIEIQESVSRGVLPSQALDTARLDLERFERQHGLYKPPEITINQSNGEIKVEGRLLGQPMLRQALQRSFDAPVTRTTLRQIAREHGRMGQHEDVYIETFLNTLFDKRLLIPVDESHFILDAHMRVIRMLPAHPAETTSAAPIELPKVSYNPARNQLFIDGELYITRSPFPAAFLKRLAQGSASALELKELAERFGVANTLAESITNFNEIFGKGFIVQDTPEVVRLNAPITIIPLNEKKSSPDQALTANRGVPAEPVRNGESRVEKRTKPFDIVIDTEEHSLYIDGEKIVIKSAAYWEILTGLAQATSRGEKATIQDIFDFQRRGNPAATTSGAGVLNNMIMSLTKQRPELRELFRTEYLATPHTKKQSALYSLFATIRPSNQVQESKTGLASFGLIDAIVLASLVEPFALEDNDTQRILKEVLGNSELPLSGVSRVSLMQAAVSKLIAVFSGDQEEVGVRIDAYKSNPALHDLLLVLYLHLPLMEQVVISTLELLNPSNRIDIENSWQEFKKKNVTVFDQPSPGRSEDEKLPEAVRRSEGESLPDSKDSGGEDESIRKSIRDILDDLKSKGITEPIRPAVANKLWDLFSHPDVADKAVRSRVAPRVKRRGAPRDYVLDLGSAQESVKIPLLVELLLLQKYGKDILSNTQISLSKLIIQELQQRTTE